jgi:predicted nucleic acid-binding protein
VTPPELQNRAFVLDASVSAAWFLPDERTPAAERAFAHLRAGMLDAHAPDLWLWECGNVIANAVKRGRTSAQDAASIWQLLDMARTRVSLEALVPGQVRAALALAVDARLSIYDAAYLWMAISLQLPLLTHDRRLAEVAVRHDVAVLDLEMVA